MFPSLISRITALVAIVVLSIIALAWALLDASKQTRESFRWVTHSASVIEAMDDALTELAEAESGQRGFLITHDPEYLRVVSARIAGSRRAIARVETLSADNPLQNARTRNLKGLIDRRAAALEKPLDAARKGNFAGARQIVAQGEGRELMTLITLSAQNFLDEEHKLQLLRVEAAEGRLTRVKRLAVIGGPIIALLVILVSGLIVRGIRHPIGILRQAMTDLGRGDKSLRISRTMSSREFAELADGYNTMADQLEKAVVDQGSSEKKLQIAHAELHRNTETLRERGEVIELLGGMAHRMQAARTDDELAQVIRIFVPRVLPGIPGTLYAHNNSRNLLIPIADWGGLTAPRDGFAPSECWALRRGQSHYVAEAGTDIICGHVNDPEATYHCEPLLAGGDVLGTLYLKGIIQTEHRFRLTVLAENIASALFNHQLQRGLREQTIRDPLTGLFNRRYMEETLAIEIARASRSGAPLSLVMCDVDHFKRFNDEFGHDAGDAVLQALAAEMRRHFREGDVACRFGGEEFTIIAPGSTAQALANRVEDVREAITELNLVQSGRTLGTISMSFGVATWEKGMSKDGASLVQAADRALYQAKREGRNRTVVELQPAA